MNPLEALLLVELADRYDSEKRLVRALPKMAEVATSKDLQKLIHSHTLETEGHVKKLDKVFESFGRKSKGKKCAATVGILKESDELAADFECTSAINAALISAAQKIEHYEMASYGFLHKWALLLGNKKAANLLKEILAEEEAAYVALTTLARSRSNNEALGGVTPI